jgi:hypothetical protein
VLLRTSFSYHLIYFVSSQNLSFKYFFFFSYLDACSDDVDEHSRIWDEQKFGDAAADQGRHDEQQDQGLGEIVRVLSKVLSSRYVMLHLFIERKLVELLAPKKIKPKELSK